MAKKIKVFISYAREDYGTAKRLYDDLKAAGLTPWMDQENLIVGQNWKKGVRQAISESDYFLAVISSAAIEKKGYFQTELNKALNELQEHPPDKIYILPVRIDDCVPKHEILSDLNWADLFPSYENGLAKLLRVFETLKEIQSPSPKPKTEAGPAAETIRQGDHIVINAGGAEDNAKAEISKPEKPKAPIANAEPKQSGREGQFIAYDNGTVLDTKTGLVWAAEDNGEDINWKNAKKYCESYRGGGHDDWRMPTRDELSGLFEAGIKFGEGIIRITDWLVWASETQGSSGANVDFSLGTRYFRRQSLSDGSRALPVRAGK